MLKISELQWSSIAKAPDRAFENFIEIMKKKENNLKETLRPCGARKQVLSHQRKGGGDQMTIQDFFASVEMICKVLRFAQQAAQVQHQTSQEDV